MKNVTPDFLKNQKEEIIKEDLEKLHDMALKYLELEKEIEKTEEALKEIKKEFNKYSQEEIPQFLLANGLSEIRLKTGEKIKIKEEINVTIKDEGVFFEFLHDRKEDDIIKLHFDFNRMEIEKLNSLFAFLNEADYNYNAKNDVHAQTKKKYFKEILGIGKEDFEQGIESGKYIKKEDLETFAKIFNYYVTKIK